MYALLWLHVDPESECPPIRPAANHASTHPDVTRAATVMTPAAGRVASELVIRGTAVGVAPESASGDRRPGLRLNIPPFSCRPSFYRA
jgi:hypothetical protein